ncbi:uncharacterized [Tachysurus ichikawai]
MLWKRERASTGGAHAAGFFPDLQRFPMNTVTRSLPTHSNSIITVRISRIRVVHRDQSIFPKRAPRQHPADFG